MILGVDLSSNNPVFNFPLANTEGCRTGYIKLGGDNIPRYASGSYAGRVDAAHAVGWAVGSYWITGGHDPVGSANFFCDHLHDFRPGDYVVLDNETLDSGNTYTDAEAATWVRAVLARIGGSPSRILHYGSKSFVASHGWPQLLATSCSFLIADYNGTPLQGHIPANIPASRVVGHQYADNANFGGALVDGNAFVDGFLTTITAGTGATLLEDDLTPQESTALQAIYDAIFHGGDSMPDAKKSIGQSLADIKALAARPVQRVVDGKAVSLPQIQDNADTNTMVRQLVADVGALKATVTAVSTGQGVDPATIQAAAKAGAEEALANLKLEAVTAAPAAK